ncbi:MAG: hypothetical protein MAG795_00056 [Candidatus Woesearchaeota archaeon]|nr:hypothetical protein [Candidatus Woesearchaeota archaeon]
MAYTKKTGGQKEFKYSKEDLERVEKKDTDSTKEFKQALSEWRVEQAKNRKTRKLLIRIMVAIFLILIILVLVYVFTKRIY